MATTAAGLREVGAWGVARSAHGILKAMERQDCASFERQLEQAESLAAEPSSYAEERRELLAAVAGDLKSSVRRFSRGVTPDLGLVEADLTLLRHLSRIPPIG